MEVQEIALGLREHTMLYFSRVINHTIYILLSIYEAKESTEEWPDQN